MFDNLALDHPKNHFTIGINDDLSHTSLEYDANFSTEPDNVVRAIFYGLGSDGTVGANKTPLKLLEKKPITMLKDISFTTPKNPALLLSLTCALDPTRSSPLT